MYLLNPLGRGACSAIPCQYVDWIMVALLTASIEERKMIIDYLSGDGYPSKKEKSALIKAVCRLAGSTWGSDDRSKIDCAFRHFKLVFETAVKVEGDIVILSINGINMMDYLVMAAQKRAVFLNGGRRKKP